MPGSCAARNCMAAARWADSAQKPRRCGWLTGMVCRAMKPVSTAAVSCRPRRFIAWPTVCTGCPTACSGLFALRSKVAAMATSLLAIWSISCRSGSGRAITCLQPPEQGRARRYDDLAQRAALAQFIQFFGDVRTAHRQAGYLSHGLGHRECQLLRPPRCKVEPRLWFCRAMTDSVCRHPPTAALAAAPRRGLGSSPNL
jgi:hypothetical protein